LPPRRPTHPLPSLPARRLQATRLVLATVKLPMSNRATNFAKSVNAKPSKHLRPPLSKRLLFATVATRTPLSQFTTTASELTLQSLSLAGSHAT
jgi:hypothetical protein